MKNNKIQNLLYIGCVLLFLVALSTYIQIKTPTDISEVENRYLTTFRDMNQTSFYDGTFQQKIEKAYCDQFPKRYLLVRIKNKMDAVFKELMEPEQTEYTLNILDVPDGTQVLKLGKSNYMINSIFYDTEENRERFTERARELNELQDRHPDTQVFVYVPTQVHETDLFDEENGLVSGANNLWAAFEEEIKVPFKRFDMTSLDLYKRMFFRSDHHPNHYGADLYYKDILTLILPEETPLSPIGEDCHIGQTFYGTFASRTGFVYGADEFCVYDYDLVPFTVTENGTPVRNYKGRKAFASYQPTPNDNLYYYNVAYPIYDPVMCLDTHRPQMDNLLIIGDSFSNSVLDLLASHYNQTYRVAPYQYLFIEGQMFDYDTFIDEHHISHVLFMYTAENYFYKDSWGDRYEQNRIVPWGGQ